MKGSSGPRGVYNASFVKHRQMMTMNGGRNRVAAVDQDGNTILHRMLCQPDCSVSEVKAVINSGIDINAQNYTDGFSPLHLAAICNNCRIISLLLRCRACNTEVKDGVGHTPLHWAVKGNFLEAASLLLQGRADLHCTNWLGCTLLHEAAGSNLVPMMIMLIKMGSRIEDQSKSGHTALHWAAMSGHRDAVICLLQRGANCNALSMGGHTPLDLSLKSDHETCAKALKDMGGKEGPGPENYSSHLGGSGGGGGGGETLPDLMGLPGGGGEAGAGEGQISGAGRGMDSTMVSIAEERGGGTDDEDTARSYPSEAQSRRSSNGSVKRGAGGGGGSGGGDSQQDTHALPSPSALPRIMTPSLSPVGEEDTSGGCLPRLGPTTPSQQHRNSHHQQQQQQHQQSPGGGGGGGVGSPPMPPSRPQTQHRLPEVRGDMNRRQLGTAGSDMVTKGRHTRLSQNGRSIKTSHADSRNKTFTLEGIEIPKLGSGHLEKSKLLQFDLIPPSPTDLPDENAFIRTDTLPQTPKSKHLVMPSPFSEKSASPNPKATPPKTRNINSGRWMMDDVSNNQTNNNALEDINNHNFVTRSKSKDKDQSVRQRLEQKRLNENRMM